MARFSGKLFGENIWGEGGEGYFQRHDSNSLLFEQVIKNHFHRIFLPSQSLDAVSPTDLLLCFEVLSPELAKERVVELQVQQVSGPSRM